MNNQPDLAGCPFCHLHHKFTRAPTTKQQQQHGRESERSILGVYTETVHSMMHFDCGNDGPRSYNDTPVIETQPLPLYLFIINGISSPPLTIFSFYVFRKREKSEWWWCRDVIGPNIKRSWGYLNEIWLESSVEEEEESQLEKQRKNCRRRRCCCVRRGGLVGHAAGCFWYAATLCRGEKRGIEKERERI